MSARPSSCSSSRTSPYTNPRCFWIRFKIVLTCIPLFVSERLVGCEQPPFSQSRTRDASSIAAPRRMEADRSVDAENAPTDPCKTTERFCTSSHTPHHRVPFRRTHKPEPSESVVSYPQILRRRLKVFTSPDDQFWSNSVVIEGADQVMLVDAQLTKTSAQRVLRTIRETHKPLSLIYITHEHADHFLGLEVFKEAYPRVRIIANTAVVDRINKVYQEKIDKWKQILGSGGASRVVMIERFDDNVITFEASHIEVITHIQGDTDENTMLWIPGQRILIAGDVVFNNMHVYTADTDRKARVKWLSALNTIRALHPSVVIPGHSNVGAPLDASTAVAFTERYLLAFEDELTRANDPNLLIRAMKDRFPSADLFVAIERGALANVKP